MKEDRRKSQSKDLFEILPQAIVQFKKNIIDPFFTDLRNKNSDESLPLRAEIFTEEQLEQHAKILARRHTLISKQPSEQLLKRLAENEGILLEVHSVLTDAVKQNNRIVPAAEWLLDNFYLIEEQIYTAKKHLPKGYSKGLPQLAKGVSAGLPRVYDIAVEIISHSDGHVNLKSLTGFVNAYQEINILKLGELWAIPIMLRLALLENLRRLSIQIYIDITNKNLADGWATQLIKVAEEDPKNLVLVIADMARSKPPMVSSFVAELTRRLQEKGNSLVLVTSWLEQTLSENGFTSTDLIQQENQKQAADQVSISNSISSLRFLSTTDWREFVEMTSAVEQILRKDPVAVYAKMDFHTRDDYRHTVEKIAKSADFSEDAVAAIAVQLAEEEFEKDSTNRAAHVGYFLNGPGLVKTERSAKMRISAFEKCRRVVRNGPFIVFTGSILLLTGSVGWWLVAKAWREGILDGWLIGLSIVLFFCISQLAISVVNWLITISASPRLLPRMDFSKGIPDDSKTMVVIPTLLNSITGISDLLENLEVRFLANRDANLFFALLTDVKDADKQELPGDELLVQFISNKVIELNKKYERASNDTFFLFHRPRQWNAGENVWMGRERKRGKLEDLNDLIRENNKGAFSVIIGDEAVYRNIKYIITLDTDTQLPRDVAWKMAASMSHPLNRPAFNKKNRRVTTGYSILQPRVSNSLSVTNSSIYSRIHGNEPGTDPYTRAISDVYQDLFEEGSFIGKGIYDVESFEKALKDKLPDNRILSHDLLEGAYARSGLISDVQLYEEYPSRYTADIQRRHRWIRGDWQIASWILPFVPGKDRRYHRNPISALSKWKIFDNLRRSLVPPSILLTLLFGWLISIHHLFWTLIVLSVIFLPALVSFVWQLFRKPTDVIFIQHLLYTTRGLKDTLYQQCIDLACLPYEAYMNLDAILRTLFRMYLSKTRLLQWNPYQNHTHGKHNIANVFRKMWFAPFFSAALFLYLSVFFPITVAKTFPFIMLWFASPFIAWLISKPVDDQQVEITTSQTIYLRKLARKIWSFYETFVTEKDNWLPPDNYQEEPVERTAHRTSPTNIGLSLLSNLTAHDFGYITSSQLADMTGKTLNTVHNMEKYRGHLYNWYDTQTLAPLFPKYISTVDSGNMVGHLITLRQGLLSIPDQKVISGAMFEGLLDEIRLLDDIVKIAGLADFGEEIAGTYVNNMEELPRLKSYIDHIEQSLTRILIDLESEPGQEADWWIQKIFTHIRSMRTELELFIPWLLLPPPPEKFRELLPSLPGIPTIVRLSKIEQSLLRKINNMFNSDNTEEETKWLTDFRACITESGRRAKELVITTEQLVVKCTQLSTIDYDFLYDRSQYLLTIGYNAEEHRKDNSYYDLLASEARLAVFVAIAQGKLPQQSWFALGRQLTSFGTTPILLSWSGSMFEYLMPMIVMPSYKNTLLDQTMKAVVQKQIDYGRKRNVPWGISESGYNMVDANLNYQYYAFGVPGLGFKRGLGEDLVISPYSTVMALMVNANDAYDNLQLLKQDGFEGRYGFYEAIDYTSSRLSRKQNYIPIKSFMVHHQGMSFLSLSHLLLKQPMQQRFEADVQIKSPLLLLQERIPRATTFYSPSVHEADISITPGGNAAMRVINTPDTTIPEVQLLSNGRYNVMVTNAGGGYSRWKNIALTRWREDCTCDNWGTFCYIRDLENDTSWSTAFQPTLVQGDNYEAVFSQGRAEFRRRDVSLETHTEIVVSPEDDIELRRVHLTNRSRKKRTIEITSYTEVVLTVALADEMHPAFSNLFVQTEINEQRNAILCTRRPRSEHEHNPCMFHVMKVHDTDIKNVSYETDRDKFIGRGNTINQPAILNQAEALSNSSGSVLDPIVSIQYRIVLEPYQTV
ncbi:MAG TPA: glucoamylase family protein, partial [Chitinophagaceae bacterium]|nr:glucoamylase family protein [Chitinophagaceae bacterium]